ncbi:MAG: universal stress protein [bacterium]
MSFKIKTILCAVDLSENSELVLSAAITEARVHDARIQLLHIIPSFDAAMAVPIVSFMGEDRFLELIKEKKGEAVAAIRKRIDKLNKEMHENDSRSGTEKIKDVHVYEGDAVIEILNMIGKLEADMLVMGSHGKGITEHTFVGSVARKVLKRVNIPVLLVPGSAR